MHPAQSILYVLVSVQAKREPVLRLDVMSSLLPAKHYGSRNILQQTGSKSSEIRLMHCDDFFSHSLTHTY